MAEEEYKYIKSKYSLGRFHTIEMACMIFWLSYGNNEFMRYSYSENLKDDGKLMILSSHYNNHFVWIYEKNFNLYLSNHYANIKELKIKFTNWI